MHLTYQGRRMNVKTFLRKHVLGNWHIYLMIVPAAVVLYLFAYVPMRGIVLAFQDYKANLYLNSPWVGLKHFNLLFITPNFHKAFRNTLLISGGRLLVQYPLTVLLALLINELRGRKTRRVLQTVYTFPHFLSWVIVAGILKNILRSDGLLNEALLRAGLLREPYGFLTSTGTFRWVLYFTDYWKEAGWSAIIYVAAMAGIDHEQYEAATIDGANRFQRIIRITLPNIQETMVVLLILSIGNMMNAGFDQIFNMYNPIVYDVSNILDTWVYELSFADTSRRPNFSFNTAIGLLKSVIGFTLLLAADRVSRKMVGYGMYSIR